MDSNCDAFALLLGQYKCGERIGGTILLRYDYNQAPIFKNWNSSVYQDAHNG